MPSLRWEWGPLTSQANRTCVPSLRAPPTPTLAIHLAQQPSHPPECQVRSEQPGFRLSRLCNLLADSTGEMKAACLTPQSCDEGALTGTTRRKAVLILKSKTNVNGYYSLLRRTEEIKIMVNWGLRGQWWSQGRGTFHDEVRVGCWLERI